MPMHLKDYFILQQISILPFYRILGLLKEIAYKFRITTSVPFNSADT